MNVKFLILIIAVLFILNILFFTNARSSQRKITLIEEIIRQKDTEIDHNAHLLQELTTREAFLSKSLEEQKKLFEEVKSDVHYTHTEHRETTRHRDKLSKQVETLRNEKVALNHLLSENFEDPDSNTIQSMNFNHFVPRSNPDRFKFWNPVCLEENIESQEKVTVEILSKCPYSGKSLAIASRSSFVIPTLKDSFQIILAYIWCQIPFAFMRYGDGEFYLATGHAVGKTLQAYKRDKWWWKGGKGKISADLDDSLGNRGNFFYGLPCPGRFHKALLYSLKRIDPMHPARSLSYSLLFWSSNTIHFTNFMNDIVEGKLSQSVILILNKSFKPYHDRLLKWSHTIYYLPDDGPNLYETHRHALLTRVRAIAKSHSNVLFLISGGPLAKPFVSEMWKMSKCNQYVDAGSALSHFVQDMPPRRVPVLDNWSCPQYKFHRNNETIQILGS